MSFLPIRAGPRKISAGYVPRKTYSLSKYRGKDGARVEEADRENREKYRGSLEYPFEYD